MSDAPEREDEAAELEADELATDDVEADEPAAEGEADEFEDEAEAKEDGPAVDPSLQPSRGFSRADLETEPDIDRDARTQEIDLSQLPPLEDVGGDEGPVSSRDRYGPPTETFPATFALHDTPSDELPRSELQRAYECLEIRPPIREFEAFARARLETLARLGESSRAEATAAGLQVGLSALRAVMSAPQKETP